MLKTEPSDSGKPKGTDEAHPANANSFLEAFKSGDAMDRLLDATAEAAADIQEDFEKQIAKAGGIGTLIASAVFNDVAMPAGFMEKFKDLIVWANQMAGEKSIGSGFGGAMGQKGSDEHREKVEEENDDGWEHVSSHLQKAREQEREREEWSQSMHSYGGMEMSGTEWSEFADELKGDTPLRRWLVEQIKAKENKTDGEAKKQADQIAMLAKMQSLPRSQWTDEMKQLDAYLNAHPDVRSKYDDYLKNSQSYSASLSQASPEIAAKSADAKSTDVSIETGSDLFASAPDLTAHHAEAVAAVEPLDAKPKTMPTLAQATAAPAPGSGFDA